VTTEERSPPTGQKAKMLRGELYLARDPELRADHERCCLLLEKFNATSVTDKAERAQILRDLLGHVGEDVAIRPPLQCDYGYNITVGNGSFINYGAVILDVAPVRIGADVQIATNVQLLTPGHPLEADVRRSGLEFGAPITILDGVWLGGGVIVCPGVTIGANTVVGAGSVVTRDLPPDVVAVGNPCRVTRRL
jgi:maltose O-acetyltransferase